MPRLVDRPPELRFIALFVGRSGVGKTVAAVSFPKPLHVDDFDGRIGGAQSVPWLDLKNITYDSYQPKESGLITRVNKKLDELLELSKMIVTNPNLALSTGVIIPTTYVMDSFTNQTYAFLCQAMPLTHGKKDATGKDIRAGKWLGPIAMYGPEDYGLEAAATYDYLAFLLTIPVKNLIFSAHTIDRYGKADPNNSYSESVVVGKKLSIRDRIGENIQTKFDHVFEFERESDRHFVRFRGDLARTTYSWLPDGRQEWTGKNFYDFMMHFKANTTGEK